MFTPEGPSIFELARQALSSTDRGYDLLAEKFDATPFRTPPSVLGPLRSIFDEHPVERAIDFCTGTGAGVQAALWVATEEVVGIDRSKGMLEQARRQVRKEGARGATSSFRVGDACGDPFLANDSESVALPAESFDLATCFGAFGHIEPHQEQPFVATVRRSLKIGGRFVFVTADPPAPLSREHLLARGFNGAMHLRNALIRPRFVMFYLTFLLPRARALLEANDFSVDVRRGRFKEHPQLLAVVATKNDRKAP